VLLVCAEVHFGREAPGTAFAAGIIGTFLLLANVPSWFGVDSARSAREAARPTADDVNVGLGGCCDPVTSHRGCFSAVSFGFQFKHMMCSGKQSQTAEWCHKVHRPKINVGAIAPAIRNAT
jgi:hypothetical protein